jgi:hypothetical protein
MAWGAAALMAAGPGAALAVEKTPDFPPPPDEKLQHVGDDDLSVDVYRMTDVAEQKTYFRVELGHRGIEAIWVRITNKTQGSRYLFDADDVAIAKDDAELARAERARSSVSTSDAESTEIVGAALLAPPLIFAGAAMISEATEVRRNLAEKQLYSHTLGPGQSVSGFVYVKTPPGGGLTGYRLKLRLRPLPAAGRPDSEFLATL